MWLIPVITPNNPNFGSFRLTNYTSFFPSLPSICSPCPQCDFNYHTLLPTHRSSVEPNNCNKMIVWWRLHLSCFIIFKKVKYPPRLCFCYNNETKAINCYYFPSFCYPLCWDIITHFTIFWERKRPQRSQKDLSHKASTGRNVWTCQTGFIFSFTALME